MNFITFDILYIFKQFIFQLNGNICLFLILSIATFFSSRFALFKDVLCNLVSITCSSSSFLASDLFLEK